MGQEFRVNTYQNEWQEDPTILRFPDGSFVIMWRSFYFDTSTYYIGAQRYTATGQPIGGEFVVDGIAGSAFEVKNITLLSDGGFVVTFSYSNGGLLEPDEVYAKIYNADFTVRKESFKCDFVNDFQSLSPDAAALSDGGFIVFFCSDASGPTFDDIYGQRYNAQGVAVGGNFLVNTGLTESDQQTPEVEQLANGNILVLWHSKGTLFVGGSLYSDELRGTIYNSAGVAIRTDFTIADAEGSSFNTGINPFAVTPLTNGGFAVARYETENPSGNIFTYDVKLSIYNAAGNVVVLDTTAFSSTNGIIYSVDVVQLTGGQIVVVWETPVNPFSTYNHDIQGRVFSSDGTPLTGIFDIAANRFDAQEDPVLAALPNGGFVVTYMSEAIDASREGIAARIFEGPFPIDTGGNLPIDGTAGNDILFGTDGVNTINGLGGNDILYGLGGADTLNGGAGNDNLYGGAGADTLNGGANFDLVWYDLATSGVYARLDGVAGSYGEASGDIFVSIEGFVGSNFNDVLVGSSSPDQLLGGAGDDALYGLENGDDLYGGLGADILNGGAGVDNASYDQATTGVYVRLDGVSAASGEAVGDTFIDIEGLFGSVFNDIFVGSDTVDNVLNGYIGDDSLYGLGANDYLIGGLGNDFLYGGTGDDQLSGDAGNDILFGGEGADSVNGGEGFDLARFDSAASGVYARLDGVVASFGEATGDTFSSVEGFVGSAFNDIFVGNNTNGDYLNGLGGNDSLYGLGGNDTLDGSAGNDSLYGGGGNDNLYGGDGADVLDGGDGFDLARYDTATAGVYARLDGVVASYGEAVGDTFTAIEGIVGSYYNDIFVGNNVNADYLFGLGGNDYFYGLGGADYIDGGAGNDTLYGGAGADQFVFNTALSAATNVDTIGDFQSNVDDIVLSQAIFAGIGANLDAAEFQLGSADAATDRILYFSGTGQLFFDADGNGAAAAVQFATVTAGTALT